ncbi:MAG: aminodeoxychorismate synthase component I [bacterium]|nr:aminodeoxychorismate synthase component I [bacterium]
MPKQSQSSATSYLTRPDLALAFPLTMKSLPKKNSVVSLPPADLFRTRGHTRGSVWLDSSLTRDNWGRTSLIATDPIREITLSDDHQSFFDELNRIALDPHLTAVGFIGYEGTLPFLGLKANRTTPGIPPAHFFVYDRVLRYDHATGVYDDPGWVEELSQGNDNEISEGMAGNDARPPNILPAVSRAEYLKAVERIKWHIHEGDIYQANFTCRFDVRSNAGPFEVYDRLRNLNPCPYGAFMNFGDYQVLSSSPERMFLLEDDRITSTPIKGTIERGRDEFEERRNLEQLVNSEKDRAELLMIVDLVRNDLGKIARTGTVTVDTLFRADAYSSLIHLMADISARLKPETTLTDILRALLPGGSITGAPKRRAVEIIDDLETGARSVYTGCIGCLGDGRADFNIAIRTIVHAKDTFHIHAGGGIVADSVPEKEFDEMQLKALNLFRAVGVEL